MSGVARFETLARIGFAARGLLYLMIAYAALVAGRPRSGSEIMSDIEPSGPGQAVLILMAVGFLGYGLWRLFEAAVDTEGNGDDLKGIAARSGGVGSGLVHLVLASTALRLALGGEPGNGASAAADWTLDLPGGALLLTILAAALVAAGLMQFVEAVRLHFLKFIDPEACRQAWVRWSGRIGYAARGVAFVVIGWLLWKAASDHDPSRVGDAGAAIAAVPEGIRGILAVGLALFGLFSLVAARYRRINDPRVLDRLRLPI